ncbi:MAG TPA: hypothetical protein VHX44_11690 [Planctomycetota bacterium]|nr:hypothetical protein [Planctomycetota bacterium]
MWSINLVDHTGLRYWATFGSLSEKLNVRFMCIVRVTYVDN